MKTKVIGYYRINHASRLTRRRGCGKRPINQQSVNYQLVIYLLLTTRPLSVFGID